MRCKVLCLVTMCIIVLNGCDSPGRRAQKQRWGCRWKEQACSGNTSDAVQVVLTEYPEVLAL